MLIFIISLVVILLYNHLKTQKSLHILQQNLYNDDNRYINWIKKNFKESFLNMELFIILCIILIYFNKLTSFIFIFISYIYLICSERKNQKQEQNKKPLVYTSRIKRILVTTYILYLAPLIYFVVCFKEENIYLYYLIISVLVYLNKVMLLISNYINIPIQKIINNRFKQKAIKKLNDMPYLEVIGITGSYGKTSSKNILNDILNIKYNAIPTPKSFNTPLGQIITINNYLDKFSDYMISEMGAYKIGEIKENCDIVHPKYGIITRLGNAHLDTFGSLENIQKGKFELIESLPSDGIGILNKDDEYQTSYKIKNDCKIVWIGIDNEEADVVAKNIKLTKDGITFDVIFKGDKKKYPFETKLLGKANIYNILAGIALGKELGISVKELQLGVKKVEPVEHRLELKKLANYYIIDDSYNSNPIGSSMALDVLEMMPGKKIIITPGMIELANEEYRLNKEFGKHIAKVCDEVILVGEKQTKAISDGLKEEKYKKEKIHIYNDVKEAIKSVESLIDGETYCLIENDLPDIFNEK